MKNTKDDSRLGTPIFLDYDVNNLLTPIKILHTEMLETIKEYFEKHGFDKKGKTDNRFTILVKQKKK